jgi:hypothetical protein
LRTLVTLLRTRAGAGSCALAAAREADWATAFARRRLSAAARRVFLCIGFGFDHAAPSLRFLKLSVVYAET